MELSKKKEKGTRIECETLRVSEKLSNQLTARESFCAQVPLETLTVLLFLFPQLLTCLFTYSFPSWPMCREVNTLL